MREFFEKHCFIFFHDWYGVPEKANVMPKEQWYWGVERCSKCNARREVLI